MPARRLTLLVVLSCCLVFFASTIVARQQVPIPEGQLVFGAFSAEFRRDGTFSLSGDGDTMRGRWSLEASEIVLGWDGAPPECVAAGRYRVAVEKAHLSFAVVMDAPRAFRSSRYTTAGMTRIPVSSVSPANESSGAFFLTRP